MESARYGIRRRGAGWHDEFAAGLADPETLLRGEDVRFLKQEPGGRAVALVTIAATRLVVKAYDESRAKHLLQSLVEGSAAARAARGIDRIAAAGLHGPQLVAVVEPAAFLKRRSWLVTVALDGVSPDVGWLQLSEAQRIRVATTLGTALRTMHARGVYPQDARSANWLLVRDRQEPVLVDLDRVRLYRRISWRRRMKNLAQLHRDLFRGGGPGEVAFAAAYAGSEDPAVVEDVRSRIVEHSSAMDARVARRGAARERRAKRAEQAAPVQR